jgi:hypothetical protein
MSGPAGGRRPSRRLLRRLLQRQRLCRCAGLTGRQSSARCQRRLAGWIERSETHLFSRLAPMGFASLYPSSGFVQASAFSRQEMPEVWLNSSPSSASEGAGKAGCRLHPWVPCKKSTGVGPQVQPESHRLSLRDGLRLTSRSPRRPGSFATVIPEKLASQELSTSIGVPGPHDFARPRQPRVVLRSCPVHRISPQRS